MSDNEMFDGHEKATSVILNKPFVSRGFTIPKGPSTKPPPTNINKPKVATPMPPKLPSINEESRKRPISKSENFLSSVWSSAYDKELPHEVLSKCKENMCDLCNAILGNPEVAKSHYDAKTHEKKVEQFLDNLYKDSGEVPPKRIRSWSTGPTYNKGAAEVANVVSNKPASSNTLGGYKQKTFQQRWLDLWDRPLPKELVDLSVASRCGLCKVDMSSLSVATAHYEGKPHAKKIKDFCVKAGSDIPQRNDEKQELTEKFCELCKIELTSPAMAKSHYNGKEHTRRVASGMEKIKVVEDKTGRFGIGGNFKTNTRYADIHLKEANKFHCDVCDIYVTSQDVLNTHRQGKNHKKKLNQAAESNGNTGNIDTAGNEPKEGSNKFHCEVCDIYTTSQDALNTHLLGKDHKKKLNHSADFRCDVCNISTSDQNGLDMHLQGAKHKKMLKKLQ